jgi:hypothetical protein
LGICLYGIKGIRGISILQAVNITCMPQVPSLENPLERL